MLECACVCVCTALYVWKGHGKILRLLYHVRHSFPCIFQSFVCLIRLRCWCGCCCCLCRYCSCWARISFRHSTIAQKCFPNKFIFLTHLYDSRQFTSNIHSCLSRTSFPIRFCVHVGLDGFRLLPFICCLFAAWPQNRRNFGHLPFSHGINFQFRSPVLVSSLEWCISKADFPDWAAVLYRQAIDI